MVVSDWDQTLTHFIGKDGQDGLQCHGIMLKHVDPDARPGLREPFDSLQEWYTLPADKRRPAQWWDDTYFKMSADFNLTEQIPACVANCNTVTRESLQETFQLLNEQKVPFIIVSAGITQVIEQLLIAANISEAKSSTVRIVANDATLPNTQMSSRVKSTACDLVEDRAALFGSRRTAIVLGDKASDCEPAKSLPEGCVALKVAFMQEKVPAGSSSDKLTELLRHFDVVISGDTGMQFVNDFVRSVAGQDNSGYAAEPAFSSIIDQLKVLDKDGTGKIDVAEMKDVLQQLKPGSESSFDSLLEESGAGDGDQMDYEKFVSFLIKPNAKEGGEHGPSEAPTVNSAQAGTTTEAVPAIPSLDDLKRAVEIAGMEELTHGLHALTQESRDRLRAMVTKLPAESPP